MAHARDDLPVPAVLDIGDAPFGGVYAISRRHHGRFLEDVQVDEVQRAGPMLQRLLGALRAVPPADGRSWRQWLVDGLVDQPTNPTAGWRTKLAADPDGDRVFRAAEERVRELVDACPERRDLVHGDLLHRNVLVSDDASAINAVFSWKCSTRGDHLFDTAWCTFWGDTFHPGIAAAIGGVSEVDADRHHCYELQIEFLFVVKTLVLGVLGARVRAAASGR
jgi:aminoglycoside phosphotransferase (APT) family kinase protein